MPREAELAIVDRVGARPRPASEAGRAIVGPRLLDLLRRVHHERTTLNYRLSDRTRLQHEELALHVAVLDRRLRAGIELHAGPAEDGARADAEVLAAEEVEHAVRARVRSGQSH